MTERQAATLRQGGHLVLTVSLALVMIALVAIQLGRGGDAQRAVSAGASAAEEALFVADAGVSHGTWLVKQGNCAPGSLLANEPFGAHAYRVSLGSVVDGFVPLTSTATLASGLDRQRQRRVETVSTDFETLVLFPEADVYVHTDDHNDGAKPDLHLKRNLAEGKIENGLIRFDLPDLGDWNVEQADLGLVIFEYNKGDSLPASPIDIGVHRASRSWREGAGGDCPCSGAIWTSYDGNPTHLWTTPGGDFDPVAEDVQTVFDAQPVHWDVTNLVEDWAEGVHANDGVMMRVASGAADQVKLHSRESTNLTERPRLTVDMSCPCGVECRRTYRDELSQRTCNPATDYAGSDGAFTRDWSPELWAEGFDDGNSCAGDVRVEPDLGDFSLRLSGDGATIERQADTSMLTTARLTFDYRMVGVSGLRYLHLEVSGDGGFSWTPLDALFGAGTDPGYRSAQYDITGFIAANTRIRFTTDNLTGAPEPHFFVDEVQIDEQPLDPIPAPPVVFPAVADSFIDEDRPDNEYGDENEMRISENLDRRRRALVDFDVSAIPLGTIIANATLRLWVVANATDVTGSQVRVYEVIEAWDEPDVNWNVRQLALPWTNPGGAHMPAPIADVFVPKDYEGAFLEFDVTPLVQAWVDGVSDHGLLLDTNRDREIGFTSRDDGGDPPPELVVTLQ